MEDQKSNFFFARVFSDTNLYKVNLSSNQVFKYGAEVIIQSEFGLNIAVVTSFETSSEKHNMKSHPSGNLIRYANIEDKAKRLQLDKKSTSIKAEINVFVHQLNLEMNLTNILIPLSEDSICVYYTATERVDFRDLLIKLRNKYKSKIFLRQISSKDRQSSFLSSSDSFFYNSHSK
jgi:cell fate regulator YaaT (PSP1 superfamily)